MARTGRPPKSVEQHRADGTKGKSILPLVVGGRAKPNPAAYLDAESQAFFVALVDELWESGILDAADRGMIELAAMELAVVAACNRDIAENGMSIDQVRGGYNGSEERTVREPNPMVPMRGRSMMHLRQLYAEIGVGAASRARLSGMGVKGRAPGNEIKGLGTARKLRMVAGGKASAT